MKMMSDLQSSHDDVANGDRGGLARPNRLIRSLLHERATALGVEVDDLPALYRLAIVGGDLRIALVMALIPFAAWVFGGWLGLGAVAVAIAAIVAAVIYVRNRGRS